VGVAAGAVEFAEDFISNNLQCVFDLSDIHAL